jgi:DNA-binding IclR family transcriptional regulator
VALDAAPGSTAAHLSSGLAIGRRTVNKHLRALHEQGLADHDDEDRWFPVNRSLDSVAADLGNLGRLQRLAVEQERQRANYDKYIQRHWRD